MSMITCPNCGEHISDTSRKCKYCGFDGIASYLLKADREKDFARRQQEIEDRMEYDFDAVHSPSRSYTNPEPVCVPKCPTCGSTNVQKISGAKRWLTTGLFGLASGDLGKSMRCKNCGYKW